MLLLYCRKVRLVKIWLKQKDAEAKSRCMRMFDSIETEYNSLRNRVFALNANEKRDEQAHLRSMVFISCGYIKCNKGEAMCVENYIEMLPNNPTCPTCGKPMLTAEDRKLKNIFIECGVTASF